MIVVDTNVTVYFWMRGSMTPAAEVLMTKDPEWVVPMLWRSEFRNALVGFLRGKRCTRDQAIAACLEAETHFDGREFDVDSADVVRLAEDSGCSAYDCEFVALAEMLGINLVTNDRQVLKAFPSVAIPLEHYQN